MGKRARPRGFYRIVDCAVIIEEQRKQTPERMAKHRSQTLHAWTCLGRKCPSKLPGYDVRKSVCRMCELWTRKLELKLAVAKAK